MPKLLTDIDMNTGNIPGLKGYQFSAVKADRLGASEYTLVTIAVDISSSVRTFQDLLKDTLKKAVDACKKSPRANNIMVRVITFSSSVTEVHGFKPLSEIDVDTDYNAINAFGNTSLYDACASAIGATAEYGKVLTKQDYGVNGILFVITDGDDNASTYSADTVRVKVEDILNNEILESFLSVLVGINATTFQSVLQNFQTTAGINEYIDAGDATPGNLAKLAAFVSRSVSSQTNALGTGQAAQINVNNASIVI